MDQVHAVRHKVLIRPRGRLVLEKVGSRIEAILTGSPRWTGGKQQLTTTTRLHAMLVGEGHEVGITTVTEAVCE